jgi:hypothetical protein
MAKPHKLPKLNSKQIFALTAIAKGVVKHPTVERFNVGWRPITVLHWYAWGDEITQQIKSLRSRKLIKITYTKNNIHDSLLGAEITELGKTELSKAKQHENA